MYHKWEPACLYAITMQDRKDMREKNIQPKIYEMWKLKSIEDEWQIMFFNLHTDSMQQSRHNFFEQNHFLMKISAKNCRTLGSPSQQGIDNNRDETVGECSLASYHGR